MLSCVKQIYQRGSQKPKVQNGQTTQWPKEEGQLQNTTQKTNDTATRTPTITEGELRYSGRVGSS